MKIIGKKRDIIQYPNLHKQIDNSSILETLDIHYFSETAYPLGISSTGLQLYSIKKKTNAIPWTN